jgi:hypothetical protein
MKKDEITLTVTAGIVIDFRRFYKRPQRAYGNQQAKYYLRNGETITFQNQQQLLRALAGQLKSNERFEMWMGLE